MRRGVKALWLLSFVSVVLVHRSETVLCAVSLNPCPQTVPVAASAKDDCHSCCDEAEPGSDNCCVVVDAGGGEFLSASGVQVPSAPVSDFALPDSALPLSPARVAEIRVELLPPDPPPPAGRELLIQVQRHLL